jgi:hypothetical protein
LNELDFDEAISTMREAMRRVALLYQQRIVDLKRELRLKDERISELTAERDEQRRAGRPGRDLAEEFEAKDPTLRRVQSAIEELDALLEGMSFDVSSTQLEEGEFWSLGSIDVHHKLRPIHAGFVEPMLRLPINEPLPERVVAFLLQIPGDGDLLKREHHDHFGWHYHYLDYKKRRSNIILCWDTRATLSGAQPLRPIFWETHAEGTRDFAARPDRWGSNKRSSMHGACSCDLGKWPLNEFKTPGQKAVAVWPPNAVLTAAPVTARQFPAKRVPR